MEACLQCSDAARDEVLYYILVQHPGRTLVFVNAISSVRRLAALLKLLRLPAQALHASMQQRQRLKALDRFKADPAGVLVATDVAARGLDIPVSHLGLLPVVFWMTDCAGALVAIGVAAGGPGHPVGTDDHLLYSFKWLLLDFAMYCCLWSSSDRYDVGFMHTF